jgi:hypothetical protein
MLNAFRWIIFRTILDYLYILLSIQPAVTRVNKSQQFLLVFYLETRVMSGD